MFAVDFHTHILPALDDGSENAEMTLEMLRAQKNQNIERVVATPHFYPDRENPERFISLREKSVLALREICKTNPDLPSVAVGAEVYFFDGISDCEFLGEMAVQDTKCVMIEMPAKPWSDRNLSELVGIHQKQRLTPVLAHVDRYVRPLSARKLFSRLAALPVLVQVNASFFINRSTRRLALSLLKEGKIHLIGSDCHNLDSRPPNVRAALDIIKSALGERALSHLSHIQSSIFIG